MPQHTESEQRKNAVVLVGAAAKKRALEDAIGVKRKKKKKHPGLKSKSNPLGITKEEQQRRTSAALAATRNKNKKKKSKGRSLVTRLLAGG